MRALWFWRAALGAAPVMLVASSALAADPASFGPCTHVPTAADVDGAKGAHKAASQFFERADYDRAIQYWRDAYGFDCTKPAILLNVASAYEKKGDRAAAVATLENYLERAPKAPDATTIAERMKNLKATLEPVAPTPAPTPPPVAAPPPAETPAPEPTAAGKRPYGLTPIIVAGSGGALALIGAVLLPIGLGEIDEANSGCPQRTNCAPSIAETGNNGRTKVLVGEIGIGVGVAAIAGGLVWQFVYNKPKPAAVSVAPLTGPGVAGMAMAGRF
jgi:tetratricopeptide (TPR) repeat protein